MQNGGPAPSTGNGRGSPFGSATTMGTSVIGTDLAILGEKITIISQNKLQIDGDIRGDVTGKQVVIGEEGSVVGTVCAEFDDGRVGEVRKLRCNVEPDGAVRFLTEIAVSTPFQPSPRIGAP